MRSRQCFPPMRRPALREGVSNKAATRSPLQCDRERL